MLIGVFLFYFDVHYCVPRKIATGFTKGAVHICHSFRMIQSDFQFNGAYLENEQCLKTKC